MASFITVTALRYWGIVVSILFLFDLILKWLWIPLTFAQKYVKFARIKRKKRET